MYGAEGEAERERARAARIAALRSAWWMVGLGALLVLTWFVIPDERWQLVAAITGVLTGAVGLLTIAWGGVEGAMPWGRRG